MPLSYPSGTLAEHRACRTGAVAFDVSHLGTVAGRGPDAFDRLQRALTNDLRQDRPGPGPVHPPARRGRRLGARRHHRVVGGDRASSTSCPTRSNTERVVDAIGGDGRHRRPGRRRRAGARGPALARRRVARGRRGAAASASALSTWQGDDVPGRRHRLHRRGRRRVRGAGRARPSAFWEAVLDAGIMPAGLGARDTLRLEAGLPAARPRAGPRHHAAAGRAGLGRGLGQGRLPGPRGAGGRAGAGRRPPPAWAWRSTAASRPGPGSRSCWSTAGRRRGHQRQLLARCSAAASPWPSCRPHRSRPGDSGRDRRPGRTAIAGHRRQPAIRRQDGRWPASSRATSSPTPTTRSPRCSPSSACRRSTSCSTSCPRPCASPAASTWRRGLSEADVARRDRRARRPPTGRRTRPGLLRRRRRLRPRHPVGGAAAGLPLRVRHRLHAVPARGGPGRAAGPLRVPDAGLPAGRHGGGQRLAVRRRHRPASRRSTWRWPPPAARGVAVSGACTRTGGRSSPPSPAAPATSWSTSPWTTGSPAGRYDRGGPGALVVQYPNYLGCLEDVAAAGELATPPGPCWSWPPTRSPLGLLRPPGAFGADVVVGEGQPFGTPLSLRRPLPRPVRLPAGARPPPAWPAGGRDGRHRGPAGLRDHPAHARAGHPPGEGVVQRLHQPDADRRGVRRSTWPGSAPPACGSWPCAAPGAPATPVRRCWPSTASSRWRAAPSLREFAVRTPVAGRRRSSTAWPTRASWPAWPWRRGVRRRPAGGGHRAADPCRDRRLRRRHREGGPMTDRSHAPAGGAPTSVPLIGHDEEPTVFELSVARPHGGLVPHHGRARVDGRGAGAGRRTCATSRAPRRGRPSATWSPTSPA